MAAFIVPKVKLVPLKEINDIKTIDFSIVSSEESRDGEVDEHISLITDSSLLSPSLFREELASTSIQAISNSIDAYIKKNEDVKSKLKASLLYLSIFPFVS